MSSRNTGFALTNNCHPSQVRVCRAADECELEGQCLCSCGRARRATPCRQIFLRKATKKRAHKRPFESYAFLERVLGRQLERSWPAGTEETPPRARWGGSSVVSRLSSGSV